jgi:hypothetical protein
MMRFFAVRLRFVVGMAVCALIGALALAQVALADATPIQLVLMYMPNVSNTNTPGASGIAELVMEEGEVRVSAANLPHLDNDQQYVAWVLNSHSNEFLRLGAFNTTPDTGSVNFETVMPDAIPDKQWNMLLLTVEDGDSPAKPSARHSLAATFPLQGDQAPPQLLPNTGGLPDEAVPVPSKSVWPSTLVLAALTGLFGIGAGYVLGLKKR